MSNCNGCNEINNCIGNEIYDGCVLASNSHSYLDVMQGDNYDTVLTKIEALLQSQEAVITSDDVVVEITNSCFELVSDCIDDVNFNYTTTLLNNGIGLSIDLNDFLTANSISTGYVVDIRVYDKNMVLLATNISNQPYLVIPSINNLLLPLTVSINVYVNIDGKIVKLKDSFNVTLCVAGTFGQQFICDNSSYFKGSLTTYLKVLNQTICNLIQKVNSL